MDRTVRYIILILLLTSCEKIDLTTLGTPEDLTSSGASTGTSTTIPSWFSDADGNLLTSPIPDGSATAPDGSATVPEVLTSDSATTVPDASTPIPDASATVPDGSATVPDASPSGKIDTLYLPRIPTAPSIINGYIITHISAGKALLLSTVEWESVPSAFSSHPTAALDTATHYNEPHILHWQIPNEAQARALKDITSQLQQLLNSEAETAPDGSAPVPEDLSSGSKTTVPDGSPSGSKAPAPITLTDSKGTNIRYLCSKAERTFSFTPSSNILKAGSTVKYHLRFVSPVILRQTTPLGQLDIPY